MHHQNQSTGVTNKKVVAYLDLLGFGSAAKADIEVAVAMLNDYQTVLQQKADATTASNYSLSPVETRIDSFDDFLPFSDSIVISSTDPDTFVSQLCDLVLDAFLINAGQYKWDLNATNPTLIEMPVINSLPLTKVTVELRPVLFKGGVSYEEVHEVKLKSMLKGKLEEQRFLAGTAVVEAVRLEENKCAEGPIILCTDAFSGQLRSGTKAKYLTLHEPTQLQQILWTNAIYVHDNDIDAYRQHFIELFAPATALWKAFKLKGYGKYYHGLLLMIIEGTKHYFLGTSVQIEIDNHIQDRLHEAGIEVINGECVLVDSSQP